MNKLRKLLEQRKETYVEKTPEDVYREVAEGSSLTPEEVSQVGGVESQHGKFDKPIQGGSARGLFQFQPKTAEELVPGSSKSLSNINTQADLMKKNLEKNKVTNIEDAYLKHNLGPTGARKFAEADDSTPVSKVMSHEVIRANPLYHGKTVGEARAAIKQKLEQGGENSEVRPSLKELITRRK
jgi:hypothetical protein